MTAEEMGRKGGKARMSSMTDAQRKDFSQKGVEARRDKKNLSPKSKNLI